MADEVDIANEIASSYIEFVTKDLSEKRKIEDKLRKDIKERECEECGNIIPLGRLKIVPTTKYCINCQSNLEKRK